MSNISKEASWIDQLMSKNIGDKVYTPENIAKKIIEEFNLEGKVLDPFRGKGAFYDNLPETVSKE